MNKYLAAYCAAAFTMVALDMLWLGVVARPLYQQGIGHLMAEKPNISAAVAFYVLYAAGLVVFAVLPFSQAPSWTSSLWMGAFFGFVAYATYDLSNLATLRGWPFGLSLIDMVWGAALSGVCAAAAQVAMRWASKG